MTATDTVLALLPNLGALQAVITSESISKGPDAYRGAAYRLEQMPYCLAAALTALLEAVRLQEEALGKLDLHSVGQNVDYSIPEEIRDPISYQIDAFLDAAVRAQNGLTGYLQHATKSSLPSGFRALAQAVLDGLLDFGGSVNRLIVEYWHSSGERLREYRDLGQHHVVLASNARIIITGGRIEMFFMPLPSNPADKAALKLVYAPDSPNALPYLATSFTELVRFLRRVIFELLGTDARTPRAVVCHMFKEGAVSDLPRAGVIVSRASIDEQLAALGVEPLR